MLIQLKDVDVLQGISLRKAFRIHPAVKKNPDLLELNDILFVNRGMHFFSVLVEHQLEQAVAAPHFFVVRANVSRVLPAYLAWYLNHKRAQHYFSQYAAGTALPHVTSKTLGYLPVTVPDFATQHRIVATYACLVAERKMTVTLLDKRQQLVSEILDRTLDTTLNKGVNS